MVEAKKKPRKKETSELRHCYEFHCKADLNITDFSSHMFNN